MKSLTLFLLFSAAMVFQGYAGASAYRFDQQQFEIQLEQSEDITNQLFLMVGNELYGGQMSSALVASPNNTTAAIIAFSSVFVPVILNRVANLLVNVTGALAFAYIFWLVNVAITIVPWHRYYMGTDGKGVKIWALYCFTLRWCGILPLIDGVFLLLDNTGEKYIENPKYLMWLD